MWTHLKRVVRESVRRRLGADSNELKAEAEESPLLERLVKTQQTEKTKGGRTPTASRQASRHETKGTKADVSIMTQTGVRRFS
jgi:hypothetical protein